MNIRIEKEKISDSKNLISMLRKIDSETTYVLLEPDEIIKNSDENVRIIKRFSGSNNSFFMLAKI
jgi:hypothetical protein